MVAARARGAEPTRAACGCARPIHARPALDLWLTQAARLVTLRGSRARRSADSTIDALVDGPPKDDLDDDEGLDPSLAFSLRLARALLGWGQPAHRIEDSLERLAEALGFEIDVLATPTGLVVTMSDGHVTRTRVVRAQPGGSDLERLSALHDLVGRVERRELTPGDADARLARILARPARTGPLGKVGAFAVVSAASAVLLGGGGMDVPVAAALGAVVGLLDAGAGRVATLARLLPSLSSLSVSMLASGIVAAGIDVRPPVVLLAAIVVLLPGLTVTTATIELATAHLVSGTSRLMGAVVTFLQLGFGMALGHRIGGLFPEAAAPADAAGLPWWADPLAALGAGAGLAVLLRVRRDDFGLVFFAVSVALVGSRVGGYFMGAEIGAFVGALAVTAAAHAHARLRDRPAAIVMVPGILLLVPGSVGFLSVRSMIESDVEAAAITGFRMLLVAMALAAGTLVATAAVPPRRAL